MARFVLAGKRATLYAPGSPTARCRHGAEITDTPAVCRLTAIRQPTIRKLHTWPRSPPTIFGTRPARTSTPAPVAARTGPPKTTPNRPCGTWSSFPDFPGPRRCAHYAPPLDWASRVCAPGRTRTHDPLLRRQPLYPAELRGRAALTLVAPRPVGGALMQWPNAPAGPRNLRQAGGRSPSDKLIRPVVAVAQVVRASGCGPEGRGFKSPRSPQTIP
jgi:hypothetical protein